MIELVEQYLHICAEDFLLDRVQAKPIYRLDTVIQQCIDKQVFPNKTINASFPMEKEAQKCTSIGERHIGRKKILFWRTSFCYYFATQIIMFQPPVNLRVYSRSTTRIRRV